MYYFFHRARSLSPFSWNRWSKKVFASSFFSHFYIWSGCIITYILFILPIVFSIVIFQTVYCMKCKKDIHQYIFRYNHFQPSFLSFCCKTLWIAMMIAEDITRSMIYITLVPFLNILENNFCLSKLFIVCVRSRLLKKTQKFFRNQRWLLVFTPNFRCNVLVSKTCFIPFWKRLWLSFPFNLSFLRFSFASFDLFSSSSPYVIQNIYSFYLMVFRWMQAWTLMNKIHRIGCWCSHCYRKTTFCSCSLVSCRIKHVGR